MDYYLNYSAIETTNNYSFSSIKTNTPMSKDLFPEFIVLKLRKLPARLPDMISTNETLIPLFKNLSLLQYFVARYGVESIESTEQGVTFRFEPIQWQPFNLDTRIQ